MGGLDNHETFAMGNVILLILNLEYFLQNFLLVNATIPQWWSFNIGSGNDLVLLGNKPMLTEFYDAT